MSAPRPGPVEAGLFIGGAWEQANESFERHDPAEPSRVTGTFAAATVADAERALAAARGAAGEWGRTTGEARGAILRRAADLLDARLDEAALRLVADMGKALGDARAEAGRTVAILRYHAADPLQPTGETYASSEPGTFALTITEPVGVACVITPWNFPLAIPAWKLAPALACGNSVVWKPASGAAGSAALLTEILAEAGLPAGVLNMLTGSGAKLGAALAAPAADALTFTGSVEVGDDLRLAAAKARLKLQLELGGKNPVLVLADADLDVAATAIARGAMLATGQRCTATSRVYVEPAVCDELIAKLVERTEAMTVGDPYDPATAIGPLASAEQFETVSGYLDTAQAEATIVTGGTACDPGDGYFVAPTVLTDVAPDSPLMREEIFGPVAIVAEASGFDAGMEAANDTEFGLSAAVFTTNLGRAMEFARRIEAGQVHINRETAGAEPHLPFGGMKASSNLQREQGRAARQFFTNSKSIYARG